MSGGSSKRMTGEARAGTAASARLDWVDALKGLGIIAVVAGHVWTRGAVRDGIYAFHMPFFFILSGYTAQHRPWGALLRSCARGLGLPFLGFSLLLLAADFAIEGARGVRPIFPDWGTGLATILLAPETLRGPFTILWFIPCLFVSRLVWNGVIAGARPAASPRVAGLMAGVLALSFLLPAMTAHSPLALLSVPGAVLLMWAGGLWRLRDPLASPVLVASALTTVIVFAWFPPINMKVGDLGWPVLSLAGAFAVTVALAALVRGLPRPALASLGWVGRRSLTVMYAHVAFIHYLSPYASKAVLLPLALGASLALDALIRQSSVGRRLLLGEPGNAR
ncbi:acyltransferase family protein [Sphingobium lignivorans]|uniref:Fucose 4-O-acetylase-like acetyltransferase n=1 Tax=Sphingobium lignivorans TaxID=2735886 RepID=A0ABR6NL57_9SPHN|nr:acyltransferase family protein [Sphingobium lignivorans]MBB5987233.1 fucose 4-O-acetylase-like acetyltransferase [Sphingobium lignivorans]